MDIEEIEDLYMVWYQHTSAGSLQVQEILRNIEDCMREAADDPDDPCSRAMVRSFNRKTRIRSVWDRLRDGKGTLSKTYCKPPYSALHFALRRYLEEVRLTPTIRALRNAHDVARLLHPEQQRGNAQPALFASAVEDEKRGTLYLSSVPISRSSAGCVCIYTEKSQQPLAVGIGLQVATPSLKAHYQLIVRNTQRDSSFGSEYAVLTLRRDSFEQFVLEENDTLSLNNLVGNFFQTPVRRFNFLQGVTPRDWGTV